MRQAARHRLSERELHEYVADVEGHDTQVTGVVGYFYAMYRAEVLARVQGLPGRDILEVGCGEGMMFDGTGTQPVQMDVSLTRVSRATGKGRFLLCADGYALPFADRSFAAVLLVAVLEHTREPSRLLAEANRVLKPGGKVVIVVPNDWTMSAGRLLQRALVSATGAADRGVVRRSDLTGFNWANVPAVLVETGFLTNPRERRLLHSSAYQQRVAAGLTAGVAAFVALSS